jgi:hypothetical protein
VRHGWEQAAEHFRVDRPAVGDPRTHAELQRRRYPRTATSTTGSDTARPVTATIPAGRCPGSSITAARHERIPPRQSSRGPGLPGSGTAR